MTLFQRACVRGGIKVRYSQGFNPRPKLSLPLPRSVGVETDGDLLTLRLNGTVSSFDSEHLLKTLAAQLPEGCEVLEVSIGKTKPAIQPVGAVYMFVVRRECLDEKLRARIKFLLASETLKLQRRINKAGRSRILDVRIFLESIKLENEHIIVECKISMAGSIRPEEILELLELDINKLAAPVRRTSVKWKQA